MSVAKRKTKKESIPGIWSMLNVASIVLYVVILLLPDPLFTDVMHIPRWYWYTVVSVIALGSSYYTSRQSQYSMRLVFALIVFPVLSFAQMLLIIGEMKFEPLVMILSCLWAAVVVEICFYYKAQLLQERGWKRFVWLALLLSVVLVGYYRVVQENEITPILFLVLALLWSVVFRYIPHKKEKTKKAGSISSIIWLVAVGVVVLLGAYHRIAAVDTYSFQNDEYYHVNTAKGLIETGEYVQWDWLEQAAGEEYVRGSIYTWQVAKSVQWFGESEWAFRLPALLWGIVFLGMLALFVRRISQSWEISFYVTTLASLDNGYIWSSNYTRMYSMLTVAVVIILWWYWKSLHISNKKGDVPIAQRWIWFFLAILLAVAAMSIHFSSLLLVVGMILTTVVFAFRYPAQRTYQKQVVVVVMLSIVGLGIHLLYPFLPLDAFTVRQNILDSYLHFPFQNMIVPAFGMILVCAFILTSIWKRWSAPILFAVMVSMPILTYMTFISYWYDARKYALFVIFLVFCVLAYAWRSVISKLIRNRLIAGVVSVLLFLWCVLSLSVPGVSQSFLFDAARSDTAYAETSLHNYEVAYHTVEEYAEIGDAVVTLQPRSYYFSRTDLNHYQILSQKQALAHQIDDIRVDYERGWIIWPKHKDYHLTQGFKSHISENYKRFKKAPFTNMVIYKWNDSAQ